MPNEKPPEELLEERKSRYRVRAYSLLEGMAANDYLDYLSVRRIVGGTATWSFYDLFGSR